MGSNPIAASTPFAQSPLFSGESARHTTLCDGHLHGSRSKDSLVCAAAGALVREQAGFEQGGGTPADGTIIAVNGKTGTDIMAELSPTAHCDAGHLL